MFCPNCNADNIRGYLCKSCGVDMIAFSKAARVSNLLYNKGLEYAKERNFSAAISVLEQCVKFKKDHYIARNLLGLLYYEVGQLGEALKQWIISYNMVKIENPATYYMQKVQSDAKDMRSKDEAVQMYNKGLSHLSRKNKDLAIIHLKKALEINPKFLSAANLLTFCLLISGDKDEALKLISHTLKIDKTNKMAIRYHIAITGSPPPKTESNKSSSTSKPTPPKRMYSSVDERSSGFGFISFSHIVSFLIGGGVIFGMLFLFVMPGWVGDMENQIAVLNAEVNNMQAIHQNLQYQYHNEIESLETINQELELEANNLRNQLFEINQIQLIANAQQIIATDQVGAAELLYNINMDLVEPQNLESVQNLMISAFTGAAQILYNSGFQNYGQGDFTIATGFFERSLRFSELAQGLTGETPFFMDNAIYFLGRIAYAQGNYQLAINLFSYVISDHPTSDIISSAIASLQEAEAALAGGVD